MSNFQGVYKKMLQPTPNPLTIDWSWLVDFHWGKNSPPNDAPWFYGWSTSHPRPQRYSPLEVEGFKSRLKISGNQWVFHNPQGYIPPMPHPPGTTALLGILVLNNPLMTVGLILQWQVWRLVPLAIGGPLSGGWFCAHLCFGGVLGLTRQF